MEHATCTGRDMLHGYPQLRFNISPLSYLNASFFSSSIPFLSGVMLDLVNAVMLTQGRVGVFRV